MIKSDYDTRQYKVYKLTNKLNVLLISDKNADKSAASLNVSVGCFQDPKDSAGLAHFLEHMLFMGTKKYPNENDFINYITSHDGIYNAFTGPDVTNYHFQINNDAFDGALERFAHFFINPLLSKASIDKEINAVHAEHSKNIQTDRWRMIGVLKMLADESHPMHKFCTGNLNTLKNGIHKKVKQFYDKWYSSNIMNLVIIDKRKMKELEKLIKPFKKIKNKNVAVRINRNNPYKKNVKIYIVPINDQINIDICWSINMENQKFARSSINFICKLLNYSGKNSFKSLLKKMDYIDDIDFMYDKIDNMTFYFIYAKIELTKNGYKNIDKIIELVYKFINYVRKLGKKKLNSMYVDFNNIAKLNYMLKEKEDGLQYAVDIAQNMQLYKTKYYLIGDTIMRKFKYTTINHVFENILSQTAINIITTKKCPTKCNKTEKYYGVKYNFNNVKTKYNQTVTSTIYNNIKYPKLGKYIPTKYDIIKHKSKGDTNMTQLPNLLWYKLDTTFKKPFAYALVQLVIKDALNNYVMLVLLVNILNTVVSEELYSAFFIGNYVNIKPMAHGFDIIFYGHTFTFLKLIKNVSHILFNYKINNKLFRRTLDNLKKNYGNEKFNTPQGQTYRQMEEHVVKNIVKLEKKIKDANKITFNDFTKYRNNFFSNYFARFLVQGNIEKKQAQQITQFFKQQKKNKYIMYKSINIKNKKIKLKSYNKQEIDSAILIVYQFDEKYDVICKVIYSILNGPFFDTLRTKKQLGYLVKCNYINLHNKIYITFAIQSSSKKSKYLEHEIMKFIKNFKLVNIHKNIETVIKTNQMKFNNMLEEFQFNMNEIKTNKFTFDRKHKNVQELLSLNKQHIINLYNNKIINGQKLVIQIDP